MISNSPRRFPLSRSPPSTIPPSSGGKFLRPRFVTEAIENAVDDLRLLLGKKCVSDIDIFGDDHARRHVAANEDLIGARAKNGAKDRIDAREPPALGELLVDQRVNAKLLAHDTLDNIAEEFRLRLGVAAALDFLAEAMRREFGDHLVEVDTGHVQLVERLNRGEARGAAGRGAGGDIAALSHGG